ncbi:MAG: hypothetical protein U0941_22370 [Planctomycetaceae bacterium]
MNETEVYARTSLLRLVEHVFNNRDGLIQPLFYGELAQRIGRLNKHGDGHGHGMGFVLGVMGRMLQPIEDEWNEPIPHIQSLVVNKSGPLKDLPDDGIKEFWPEYPEMTLVEKRNKTRAEHQKIIAFGSRWNDVLRRLDLPPVVPDVTGHTSKGRFGSGGESQRHKALKEYVRNNPELVGAKSDWQSFVEYALPSLDEVDVFFRKSHECVAVEVKSAISDSYQSDYERGLFQIIKYDALLTAMAKSGAYGIPPQIKLVLVLESFLPEQYRQLAKLLGVTILENVKLPEHA